MMINNESKSQSRISKYSSPLMFYQFAQLAYHTKSINLGHGYPDWNPPNFFLENYPKNITNPLVSHQYNRSLGNLQLVKAIAKKYSPIFNREINPLSEIFVTVGAEGALYTTLTALISEGDEAIIMEPFYESYLPIVLYAGGKVIGVPLLHPSKRNLAEYENLDPSGNISPSFKDRWEIDWDKFKQSFTEKTKVLIINNPCNPTGKIFTTEELTKIAEILQDYPQVVVVMDEVYEHMVYDDFEALPRMAAIEGMWDRTISIISAGKAFSATGIRIGWAISSKNLLQTIIPIHVCSVYCLYEPLMITVAECLENATKPYEGFDSYYSWLRQEYCSKRNYMISQLAALKNIGLHFYLPEGGMFIIAEINAEETEPLHQLEGDDNSIKYTKDYNYLINLAYEKGVLFMPLSAFYTQENKMCGANYIRIAFCKKKDTIDQALTKLCQSKPEEPNEINK